MGMNQETCDELKDRSTAEMEARQHSFTRKLEARHAIEHQIEQLKKSGQVILFSDEEERLLRSFRQFKLTCRPGAVFKWQTRPLSEQNGVVILEEGAVVHIVDPANVSQE